MLEMLHAFVSGLFQVFAWSTLSLMCIGIAVGFVVGILPGLGGPTALALMLPFIFKMQAVEAFAFLLGMTAVTATTGDITSVLFGVPGEPTTASTIVDGHPMAKRGEAGRALGAVLMSSLVGAIFGAFSIAVAIPIIRPLVLTFGSPEFFMLSILGLAFVASLSGEAQLKGLISAGLGMLMATVGLDQISGIQRYTFGQLFLWDGVGLVAVTIGFYAIPETIELAVLGTSIAQQEVGKLGGVMEGVKDTFRHWWLVIRCSAIGTFTAIIPGMGGATTQWLAYAHSVQSSKDKARFGKGAVEGVLGPGAANNSTLGGSMITTVAFGVPASVIMAILLGAFIIQGLVPGPDMLIPEPKGHLSLTFSFVWVIIISNIITVGLCFLFLEPLAKITQVRGSLLIPLIVLLIYLGAFAEKNAFEDMLVVLFFGAIGWVMQKLDWPRPPMLLGLVLGPLAENRLFLSSDNYGFAWLWRPGVLIILAVTLFGIVYPALKERANKKKAQLGSSPAPAANDTAQKGLTWFSVFSFVIVAALVWALWESRNFGFRAGLFPWAIGFPVLALALVQLVLDLMGKGRKPTTSGAMDIGPDIPSGLVYRRTAATFGWILGFLLAIWLLGFSLAVPVTCVAYLKMARERWPITLILSFCAWGFFYVLFERALHVPFPDPALLTWFKGAP
jgi:TctA family transporter